MNVYADDIASSLNGVDLFVCIELLRKEYISVE